MEVAHATARDHNLTLFPTEIHMDRNWLTFSLALTCTATIALADDNDDLFSKLDANGDGTVVKDELNEDQTRFFERLIRVGDKNEDGKLSKDEFKAVTNKEDSAAPGNNAEQGRESGIRRFVDGIFQRLDKNKDSKLNRDEIPEEMKPRFNSLFDRLDKDELTKEEVASAFASMNRGQQPQNREEGKKRLMEFVKRHDGNEDGKLSRDEVLEKNPGLERVFDLLKKDEATIEEFVNAMLGPRDRRPQGRPSDGDGQNRPRSEGTDRRPEGRSPQTPRGPEGRRGPAFLGVLDADKNGKISQKEMLMAGRLFEELDRNEDGELDMPELFGFQGGPGAGRGPQGRPEMGRPEMGRDGERRPQRPEMEGKPEDRRPREGNRPRSEGARPEGPRPGQNGGPPRGFGPEQIIERFDKDDDGKISKEEAPERMKGDFENLDSDDDGHISSDELKEAFERRFGRGGQGRRPGGNQNDNEDKEAGPKA